MNHGGEAPTSIAVPGEARRVGASWRALTAVDPSRDRFEPAMVAGLPEPARRWLTHAIAPGTELSGSVRLTMTGTIRLGAWRPFTATQVLTPPRGYIWAATARILGVPVTGYDRLSDGTGEMRWRLLGAIGVLTATGSDVTRSAAGRLAGELVLVPTAFRTATWTPTGDPDTVVATWRIGAEHEAVELHVGPHGEVRAAVVQRWGNPGGGPFARHPFAAVVHEERTFAGVTIPSALTAGWWWGTDRQGDGEFFRARITSAAWAPSE